MPDLCGINGYFLREGRASREFNFKKESRAESIIEDRIGLFLRNFKTRPTVYFSGFLFSDLASAENMIHFDL